MTSSRIMAMNRSTGPDGQSWQAAPLGFDLAARQSEIDQAALRRWRLDRLRTELRRRDYAGALLADPMNIRYATGARNMAVWTMHAPGRYAFVATEGPVVLFDFSSTHHLRQPIDAVDELRASTPWFYFLAGPRVAEKTAIWAEEVAALVRSHGGGNRRLAIDRCEPWGAVRLTNSGLQLFDAQDGKELRLLNGVHGLTALAFSPDGRLLAANGNEGVRVYPRETTDKYKLQPDESLNRLIEHDIRGRLGDDTVIAQSVNDIPGVWISFKIDDDDYWVALDRDQLDNATGLQWAGWGVFALALLGEGVEA